MKALPEITLVCADCKNYGNAVSAIRETLKHIAPGRTIFFTDAPLFFPDIEVVNIPRITSTRGYSEFILKRMLNATHIDTPYILIVQADGFVLNGDLWDDEYLKYDYIGAPWIYDHDRQVGNGGFSLRSTALHKIVADDKLIDVLHPEDQSLCIIYKYYLEEKYGIKFAPLELAQKFSYELREPVSPTFGFHGTHHEPYQEHIMITRRDAMGDVIMTEPILHYYYEKGYKVILNTLPQFESLFVQHYFPIYFPRQINPKIKHREISLDMAYEIVPTKNHLEAYYDVCGIPVAERVMRNPVLTLNFDPALPEMKLFKKYAVIHKDIRAQPGRNIYGIDWARIVMRLELEGYTTILIGKGESSEIVGAIKMNTPTDPFLKWVIGGADLFIGADSGPANMAVAMGVPSVIFTGSVDLRLIFSDLSNILWISRHDENKVCDKPYCWHSLQGTQGVKCYIDEKNPPCVQFNTEEVMDKIKDFICLK